MITLLFNNILSFLSEKWGILSSIGVGLYILFRGVEYIEQSALSREEVKNLRDSIASQKRGASIRNDYIKEITFTNERTLDSIMREWGEVR